MEKMLEGTVTWSCLQGQSFNGTQLGVQHFLQDMQSLRVIAAEAFVLNSDSPLINFKEASLPPAVGTGQCSGKWGTARVVSMGHRAGSAGDGHRTWSWQWTRGSHPAEHTATCTAGYRPCH